MFWLANNIENDSVFLGDIDWNAIINQGFAIGSQVIGAVGKRPTTQIGYNANTDSIFAIGGAGGTIASGYPVNYATNPYASNPYAANPYGNPSLGVGTSVGSSLGSGLDGAFNWAAQNPLLVAGGALALFLLFKEPPRRR